MPVSKRHHYTPRYYLKRFENEVGALWRLDRETGIVTSGNNARFGYKKHWNTLRNPPPGYDPDWAEKQIARIDGYASKIISEILNGYFPDDIRPLALAISFMHYNQPRIMREFETTHPERVKDWNDDIRLIFKLRAALDNWKHYIPIYYAVNVIDSDNNDVFFTSSNPLIEFSNQPTMFLPISTKHCLFLSHDPRHKSMRPMFTACDAATVVGINRKTIENAWQYVYSSSPKFSQ